MSLLIKALDTLDRYKQAEKNKFNPNEQLDDFNLPSSASPLTLKPAMSVTEIFKPNEIQHENLIAPSEVNTTFKGLSEVTSNQGLTLEDEAGLDKIPLAKKLSIKLDNTKSSSIASLNEAEKTINNDFTLDFPTSLAETKFPPQLEINQKLAANVFIANKIQKTQPSKSALALLAFAGALIIWLGLQGYGYIKLLLMPVAATNVLGLTATVQEVHLKAEERQNFGASPSEKISIVPKPMQAIVALLPKESVNAHGHNEKALSNKRNEPKPKINTTALHAITEAASSNAVIAPQQHSALQLVTKAPISGVDPTLLAAYDAYTGGKDKEAQQLYRQVLQRDVRNVDALLGMALISKRQNREADAMGWYQKVIEIEPKNSLAQIAMVSTTTSNDKVGMESRMKSMLAMHPDAANLHAALGNLYAEQNEWPSAQEAYFNASRFAPNNADYAFNLAISLDELGKTALALKQYQRALALLTATGASSPDKTQLEARIQVLQVN